MQAVFLLFSAFFISLFGLFTDLNQSVFSGATPNVQETINAMVSTLEANPSTPTAYFAQMEATAQPSPLPTATLQPNGILQNVTTIPTADFSKAKIIETFDNDSAGFGIPAQGIEDEYLALSFQKGFLVLSPRTQKNWRSWRLRPPAIRDGAVEMEFSILSCKFQDQFGILVRSPNYESGSGYYCAIDCDGNISVYRDTLLLSSGNYSAQLNDQSLSRNTLRVSMNGPQITVFLNGHKTVSVDDQTYPEGFSGFYTSPMNQGTLNVAIDSFSLYF